LKAKVAQLLMMAAYRTQVQEALRLAAPLMAQLTRTGGVDYVKIFVIYLATTQERRVVNEFAVQVQRYASGTGGDMLTYAEELRQEGRQDGLQRGLQKGEIKGKVETIENLLTVGADWSLITRATGITPEGFQQLKEELRQLAEPDDPGSSDPPCYSFAPQLNSDTLIQRGGGTGPAKPRQPNGCSAMLRPFD
jgi:hypothetical protein